jgi:Ca2+-transporting ATPase
MHGNVVDLSTPMRSNATLTINEMYEIYNLLITILRAKGTLRTIGLAYIEKDQITQEDQTNPPESGFTLIGICGIMDPVRAAVPLAVKSCQNAGIRVRMLTGDNIDTAKNIAKECGIYREGIDEAIEGPAFRKLSNEQVDDIIPRLSVMARSSPQDKYRLVKRLRELGEVVAVTGDGTNDAPQLKEGK